MSSKAAIRQFEISFGVLDDLGGTNVAATQKLSRHLLGCQPASALTFRLSMNHNRTDNRNALNSVLSRHVLQNGFYLLLFCVCASPFALAQRQAHVSRSSGRSTASTLRPAPRRALGTDESVTWQNSTVHDGFNPASPLAPPLELKWSRDLSTSGVTSISYPLIAQAMVFVATETSNNTNIFFALDENSGATIWSADVSGMYGAGFANAAYDSGKVFVLNFDGLMKAFDAASGNLLWSVNLPDQFFFTSPPTAANGIVFTGGSESGGTVYAVDETSGQVLWTMPVENGDSSSPAVVGGTVYVSYACPQAYAFDATNGQQLWNYPSACPNGCEGGGGTTPVVHTGLVYVRDSLCTNTNGVILDASTGNMTGGFNSDTPPAFIGNLALYFQSGTVVGVDIPSGQQLWSFAGGWRFDFSARYCEPDNLHWQQFRHALWTQYQRSADMERSGWCSDSSL